MNSRQNDPALLQSIFESSIEGILVVDDKGSILDANPSCERMFGYGHGELAGKNLEGLLPEKFKNRHKKHRNKYAKSPENRVMGLGLDLWGQKKDGSEFPLDISLTPSKVKGKPVTIAYIKNATRRRNDFTLIERSNKVLIESNRKYSTLIGNLQGIVYRCKNDRDWSMEYISPGCLPITGYSPKEFLEGKVHFSHITFKEDQEIVWNDTQKGIKEKKPFNLSFRITSKNGDIKYLRELGQGIFDENGKLEALEGFITDITGQKETELLLRENESKNKALLEALPDMMLIQNHNGDYLDCFAPEPEKLFMPPEEFIGKNMKEVLPPQVFVTVKNAHKRAISEKKIQIVEYSAVIDSSESFWEARVVPLNQHALLTIVRDVTENKIMERELSNTLSQNNALLKAIPDTILTLDAKGNYLDIYTSGSDNWLISKDELIGQNMKQRLSKSNYRLIKLALDKTLLHKENQQVEYEIERANGRRQYETRFVFMGEDKAMVIARDITRRKQIENKLFIRNRALEAAGNGIIIVDAQEKGLPIIFGNEAFLRLTGYTNSEIMGKNCRFLQNDDRQQEAIATIRQAIKKQKPCQTILRNYRKDGSLFYNELTITPVFNDLGKTTHFIGVQNDVTDRKKDEVFKGHIRKVLEMVAQHKSLKIVGMEIVKTMESSIKEGMASILTLDSKKNTLHKLVAPNLPESFSNAIEGIGIGPKVGSCGTAAHLKKAIIVTDVAKDPRWKDFKDLALENGLRACWSFPVLSSDKKVLGTFAIYHKTIKTPTKGQKEIIANLVQLTSIALEQHHGRKELERSRWLLQDYASELELKVAERTDELKVTVKKLVEANLNLEDQVLETKAAENKALESQAMFTAISRNFPKGVIIVFNSDFGIVYIDGGELRRLGYDKNQFEGVRIDDIAVFSKQRISRIKEDIEKTMKGEQLSFEIQFRNRTYAVNTSPLQLGNDNAKWTLFVYNDISKQKQAEINIKEALKKEQELNELKSRFISMASHEFRTPLTAILSSATLIGKQNQPNKVQKREKYVKQIESNVRNLVVILNDFLSLSKLEEGKTDFRPENFDLVQLLKQVINEIETGKKEGQKIIFKSQLPIISVALDAKLMRHILVNLVSNATKYSEEGTNIDIAITTQDNKVLISVTDEGIGIPLEEQVNLFDRFFRATNAVNIQGTGLGLHIVKQYTELMGGTVSFKSEIGKGTTFMVEFESTLNPEGDLAS